MRGTRSEWGQDNLHVHLTYTLKESTPPANSMCVTTSTPNICFQMTSIAFCLTELCSVNNYYTLKIISIVFQVDTYTRNTWKITIIQHKPIWKFIKEIYICAKDAGKDSPYTMLFNKVKIESSYIIIIFYLNYRLFKSYFGP